VRRRRPSPARLAVVVAVVGAVAGGAAALGGCGPTETCRAWVACQRAVDASVDVAAWEDGGSCWVAPRAAAACDAQCDAALAGLRALPDPPAVCFEPGGAP
jgi:hypothetical protein